MKRIKLHQWAKDNGLSQRGAYSMFRKGKLPGASQLPSGTILVDLPEEIKIVPDKTITYSRVSTTKQKDDLDRQVVRLNDYCAANGWIVHKEYREIASGLNDKRPYLLRIIERDQPTRLVVEHKDRLTRFGFNYLKVLFDKMNCEIIIINQSDIVETDLMTDFISIITSMTARLYGLRRSKRKTEKIIEELNKDDNDHDRSVNII